GGFSARSDADFMRTDTYVHVDFPHYSATYCRVLSGAFPSWSLDGHCHLGQPHALARLECPGPLALHGDDAAISLALRCAWCRAGALPHLCPVCRTHGANRRV